MLPEFHKPPHFLPVAELVLGMPTRSRAERREAARNFRRQKAGPKQQLPKRRKFHKGGHNKVR